MIEDDLRALLTHRAGDVEDNATRVGEVHTRITGIRRRRTAGAALALILVALAGLALTRLPGHPESLPTGVPPGPWYTSNNIYPTVPGWDVAVPLTTEGPYDSFTPVKDTPLRMLIVVRCDRPGRLVVRNRGASGATASVNCSIAANGRYEGVTELDVEAAQLLFEQTRFTGTDDSLNNVRWEPGSAGRWDMAVLTAIAPDRLTPNWNGLHPVVSGADHPDGTATGRITVPRPSPGGSGFSITVACVEGVRLAVSVPAGPLATVVCDQAHGLSQGQVSAEVSAADMGRLGLHTGDEVELAVRSVGAHRDQWQLDRPT